MADYHGLTKLEDTNKTVLDEMLFIKFESALKGNSKDADFRFNQAYGAPPKYEEAKRDYQNDFKNKKGSLDDLSINELKILLKGI